MTTPLQRELRSRMDALDLSLDRMLDRASVYGCELSRHQLQYLLTERQTIPPRAELEPLCKVVGLDWRDVVDLL